MKYVVKLAKHLGKTGTAWHGPTLPKYDKLLQNTIMLAWIRVQKSYLGTSVMYFCLSK